MDERYIRDVTRLIIDSTMNLEETIKFLDETIQAMIRDWAEAKHVDDLAEISVVGTIVALAAVKALAENQLKGK
jgi:hypothetical protein